MPGSSAEQGTSAPEPSKRAQAKAPGSEPETAQEKAEAALVARAMALADAAGRQVGGEENSATQSQSAPDQPETAATANSESAPAPDYGTPTNLIPPHVPVTSGASASAPGVSFDSPGLGGSASTGSAPSEPVQAAQPPSAPPSGPLTGYSGATYSGATDAPMANMPAERKPTAAEQQAQARAEAARAQVQAAYEKARAQTEAAQRQTQAADRSGQSQTAGGFADVIGGTQDDPDADAKPSTPIGSVGNPIGRPKPVAPPPSPAGSQSGQHAPAEAQTQDVIWGLTPQGASLDTPAGNPSAPTKAAQTLAPVERYPNIEAPDTVTAGQEIAVQVSLTSEQISPETKILSGVQSGGKLQLQMAEGERQWTLTVNLTVPGMEITRGGTNTAEISIERDSDSGVAVFYLRAQPLDAANSAGRRDTRILATLWHEGALLARLSRPLTIVSAAPAATANAASGASSLRSAAPAPMARTMPAAAATQPSATPVAAVQLDPTLAAPDLTIIENRVGNTLRLVFYSASSPPVEADIADPDALHAWINSHFKEMASRGRGATAEPAAADSGAAQLHAQDYLNGFGAELYDRFAPQAFKDLLSRMLEAGHAGFSSIQIYSDDPSLPWELMRPKLANSNERMDFLGATFSIARWPVTRRGMMRPPQSLMVEESVVIAPGYQGGKSLQAASLELTTLKKMRGFTEVSGSYAAVRQLAGHPPQGFVHFAGHGAVMDKDGVPQFAILLEDSEMDPGTWQALETSGTAVHPLFFFNACDVGESRQFMNDVDGWAPALLDGGASGYIGALWPVSDTTAELFASTFYDSIAKELALGEHASVAGILTRTREEVFRKTQDPTALAYVFYGDPKLTLTKPQ